MRLGHNQILVLKIAKRKGYVTVHDVEKIYGIKCSRTRSGRLTSSGLKIMSVLNKFVELEFFKREEQTHPISIYESPIVFKITEKGLLFLIEKKYN